ncbi:hypothetical protein [Teichococcus oryzae]|uniref:Uncharacterized protein n=1 Tax=Teichococcus oryzae TaxID=1608942 RepID=A0A5B2TC38_9PROT|nr:hypothetical protein [Pseudoroseomonas oryzae]KAA2211635.1 hypothetical protein F0Q34_19140 [Pseudoroseomonas oryzae]
MMFLARSSAGLLLWAFGFSALYALHGFGCESGWHEVGIAGSTLFRWVMVSTWMLLCIAGLVTIWWMRSAPAGFERRLSLASAVIGCVATVITGVPVTIASVCV